MIGFDYTYISSHEILDRTKLLTEYSILDIIVLIILFIITYITIYYLIPYLNVYLNHREVIKEKEKKKEIARRIVLQKDIDEKLLKRLNIK